MTRIRQGAPGVSCSPRMNPAWSQRKIVEAATPSSFAALPTGSSSPSGGSARWLVCGDLTVAAQAADDDRGEPFAGGGAAALPVEDPGDLAVVVVGGEPADQHDGVLVGADRGLRFGERDRELGDRAAFPSDGEQRAALFALEGDDHFLDQAAEQLLAVPVSGRGRGPHAADVGAERQQPLALLRCERARLLLFAQRELGLCLAELAECVLPVSPQAARDEPVLRPDLAIAPLRPLRLVSGALDLQPPLLQRGVVVLLERLAAGSAAFTPDRVSAASSAPVTAWSICPPPTRTHHSPRF